MSHDPDTSPLSSPVNPTVIDLDPDQVTEDTKPTSDQTARGANAPTAPRSSSSLRLPAFAATLLIGTIAGGWLYRDALSSYFPSDQVKALGERVDMLGKGHEGLASQMQALDRLSTQLKTDVDALETSVGAAASETKSVTDGLAAARDTIASLETAIAETRVTLQDLANRPAAAGGGSTPAALPSDLATRPTASNLNWAAGQTATPNKVDVQLSPTGAIKIYNRFGSVNVLADVVGYYTRSGIEDLEARLAALEAGRVVGASAHRDNIMPSPPGYGPILSVTIEAPGSGTIQIVGTVYTYGDVGASATCRLSHNEDFSADLDDTDRPYYMAGVGNNHCATSGAVAVDAGTHVVTLVSAVPTNGGIEDASLDALFVPDGTVVDFGTAALPTGGTTGGVIGHPDAPAASGAEG